MEDSETLRESERRTETQQTDTERDRERQTAD